MKRIVLWALVQLYVAGLMLCSGCNMTTGAGGGGNDSTTREARSLLGNIFKIDGKILGAMDLKTMAPLLNAAGKAYGVIGAGDQFVEWDDRLLEALGRKVDDAAAKGVDPFADVASVDGPWTDADGAPVKFPIKRDRVKRITETFGAPTTPPVVVPSPVVTVPGTTPGTGTAPVPLQPVPGTPAQPDDDDAALDRFDGVP